MGEIVNLRRARKARERIRRDATAAERRAVFGRSKDERAVGEAQQALEERRLSGHRLSQDDDPPRD